MLIGGLHDRFQSEALPCTVLRLQTRMGGGDACIPHLMSLLCNLGKDHVLITGSERIHIHCISFSFQLLRCSLSQVGDVTELMYSCCVESKFQSAAVPYDVIAKVSSGMRVEVLSFIASNT